jgi:hypothetical protein
MAEPTGRNKKYKPSTEDYKYLASLRNLSKNYADVPAISKEEITKKQMRNETADTATTPSEYMAPYYGSDVNLAREAKIASAYRNKLESELKRPKGFFEVPPEERLFSAAKVKVDPTLSASYAPKDKIVSVNAKEGDDIKKSNAAVYQKWLDSEDEIKVDRAKEDVYDNDYSSASDSGGEEDPKKSMASTLEHELGHHVYRTNFDVKFDYDKPEKYLVAKSITDNQPAKSSYLGSANELAQGLGRLQRELYEQKGTRLTEPEDLYKLIKSEDKLEGLSPEGRRVINHLRKQGDSDKANNYLKEVSRMAPMFVKNDEKEDFVSAVNNRLS